MGQAPIGIFNSNKAIGNPKLEGTAQYKVHDQSYTLKGAGYNIWFGRDEFQYLYNRIDGDFILTANFEFAGEGVDLHRKVGWMIRDTEEENSPHVSATIHGDGLTVLQWRSLKGAHMRAPQDEIRSPKSHYNIIQLERIGKKVIMRVAHDGEPLQTIGSKILENLPDTLLAGLFICSHNADVVEEARIWNVRIEKTVPDNYDPYRQGFLKSRLETIDIFTGKRKLVFEEESAFEAPNWMPDGKSLLVNKNGYLYTVPVEGGKMELFHTDFANHNNNDHGISMNGKWIALSHHRYEMPGNGSTVYVMPIEGGKPKIVTQKTPSYWHGWHPNSKSVLYVAQRDDQKSFHIYEAAVNTGVEKQLTFFEGTHVDGPEYSPDGKYIYYNGSQTGTMQIWKMKPNGTEHQQLTFDENNDWFPHISPDGKWIAYLSFPSTIDVESHPFYKRVELKIMPTSEGSTRKTIAYLYGGQGTINVPSWSPDSKSVSFVSYSK